MRTENGKVKTENGKVRTENGKGKERRVGEKRKKVTDYNNTAINHLFFFSIYLLCSYVSIMNCAVSSAVLNSMPSASGASPKSFRIWRA